MKYRSLTIEELQELEKEFVNFLILNGIEANDWEKIKKDNLSHANELIDMFSDAVFERIMKRIEYLEYREPKEIKTFQCLSDRLVLVGMTAANIDADFTDSVYMQKAIQNPPESLKVYTIKKKYSKERELELFDMIQAGCTISDAVIFKSLCLALVK
jgi:hypothetical protein